MQEAVLVEAASSGEADTDRMFQKESSVAIAGKEVVQLLEVGGISTDRIYAPI